MLPLEPRAEDALVPADRTVVLVSDLHLGDGTVCDPFGRKDDDLRRLLGHVARAADALVIAGDGFDLAQAWSLERIFAAHRALLEDLAALARSLPVYYLQGNHDGRPAELAALLPLRYHPRLFLGAETLVEHGNAWDPRNLPGDRAAFWGARVHTLLERVIRSPVRIPMRKHYCWSTRLGHWLFYRYGWYRRLKAGALRRLGRAERARRELEFLDYWGRGEWGDTHGLIGQAEALLARGRLRTLVWGHAHQAGRVRLPGGLYVNCGSWTYEDASYATWRGGEIEVRDWRSGRLVGDEEYRAVLGPLRERSFFEWWQAYYRGWFRYDVEAMRRAAGGAGCEAAGGPGCSDVFETK